METKLKSQSIQQEFLNGWINASETWTRESDNSFSEPIDATLKYQKGDKIRYKQGGAYKYQYVIGVGAYSGGKTIITTTGGSAYVFTNGTAITDNYYSHQTSPVGFPAYFSYTPTYTGFSSNPTIGMWFKLIGGTCYLHGYASGTGTSNANNFLISLPISASTSTRSYQPGYAVDNDGETSALFAISGADNSTNMIISKGFSINSLNWTTSGTKYCDPPPMFYEIA